MQGVEFERHALFALPDLLHSLLNLDADDAPIEIETCQGDERFDASVRAKGHQWFFEVKASSGPGTIDQVADRFEKLLDEGDMAAAVLVVPYMSTAGGIAASRRNINWIDLSGNARIFRDRVHILVEGRKNKFTQRGRPASAFATKSSRIARHMLSDPSRWWKQTELSRETGLDRGRVSRVVRRLEDDELLVRRGSTLRPKKPELLLDAWAEKYHLDRHDLVNGHLSGSGTDLAMSLADKLQSAGIRHGFTGLPAAWAYSKHARFRLCSVYVEMDPRTAAAEVGMRPTERGANIQLIGPNDLDVLHSSRLVAGYQCVSPVQTYLDLRDLPERAKEAADHLRTEGLLWSDHEQ